MQTVLPLLREYWKVMVPVSLAFLALVVLLWYALPDPDRASPEANCRAMRVALQNGDMKKVAYLSTQDGLEVIERLLKHLGSTQKVAEGFPVDLPRSTRDRSHETEVAFKEKGTYYHFNASRVFLNPSAVEWKFRGIEYP